MIVRRLIGVRPTLSAILPAGLRILVWTYVFLALALGGWAAAISMATRWEPLIIESGSMAPSIRPGDVVFVAPVGDETIAQGAIVTYETDAGA
ncbi:MAG: hypothetical protein AAF467_06065 [Actinomycetota bacterium]